MYRVRRWSVRNARLLERFYEAFEACCVRLHPLARAIGYRRLERPVAFVERQVKGLLFDCRMCGQCALSSTGMSCPMNCPKTLRNGPCGGVRDDGNCEVLPSMRCVWVDAWDGSLRMRRGAAAMQQIQITVDHRLLGSSSWLSVMRRKGEERALRAKPAGAAP
jgi:hypothetical protein